ncbi:unnamed protein product [Rotaria sordida]|uniref:Uncharacterized protein n=1 Tax=Rotaria sordida TaxID=392033 RepID=A0A814LRF0_9BILA|nr:unnamed protein product [Rotaria sordida]
MMVRVQVHPSTLFAVDASKLAHGHSYIPSKNTDLTGQTIIITGAASGIGRVAAIEFAKLGAKVILGIRDQNRAEQVAQDLEIKNFAEKILKDEEYVNILLNNAGIAYVKHTLTFDGLEMDFGTNHIGHFYLTKLLLPLLIKSKGRIINVSSIGHCFIDNKINYEFPSSSYDARLAYNQSKLAQIWHAYLLQERYGEQGINAYSLHPGIIYTGLTRQIPKFFELIYQLILFIVGKSLYEGTQTSLYCSLSNKAKPGKFHADCKEAKSSPLAYNKILAEECWNFSEKIINEKTKDF